MINYRKYHQGQLIHTRKVIAIFIILFFITISVKGQNEETLISLNKPKIEAIIDTVINCFEKHYVYPEKVLEIKNVILDNFKKGEYSNIKKLEELTERLQTDLYQITKDHHIGFSVVARKEGYSSHNKHSLTSDNEKQLARKNFYFLKLEILPGNIGYLRLDRFKGTNSACETATAAMRFLANTDAIIVDLRYNYGGGGPVGQILASYFFEEPTEVGSLYFPGNDSVYQTWTHWVPGNKLAKSKLYILTSSQTASAAEWFSSTMQAKKNAVVVGETTKGASHWRDYYYFPEFDLEIKMPIARPIERDWEGIGVSPDIEVPEHLALKKANIIALQNFLSDCEDENNKGDLEWFLKIEKMKLESSTVNDDELKEYSGKYGENQLIVVRNGNLYWHQSESEEFVLLPFAKDAFIFSDSEDYIVYFVRDNANKVNGYKLLTKNQKENPVRIKVEN